MKSLAFGRLKDDDLGEEAEPFNLARLCAKSCLAAFFTAITVEIMLEPLLLEPLPGRELRMRGSLSPLLIQADRALGVSVSESPDLSEPAGVSDPEDFIIPIAAPPSMQRGEREGGRGISH